MLVRYEKGEVMADGLVGGVRRASGWSIVLGILMIIAGMIAIFAPLAAGVVVVYVVGWMAIFDGGAQIFYAFSGQEEKHRWWEALLGLIYILAGIYILMHPLGGLLAFTLLIACFLIVYAIFALILAFRMRPGAGWGWVLFDGLITLLLGVLIYIHWPGTSDWVIGTLIGISFIVSGVTRLMVSMAVRNLTSRVA
jgi:uncharacterized membrane protein HdeD (DUF308 family)